MTSPRYCRKAPDGKPPSASQTSHPKASEPGDTGGGDIMFNRLQVQDGRNGAKKRKVTKAALLKQVEAQEVAAKTGEVPAGQVLCCVTVTHEAVLVWYGLSG